MASTAIRPEYNTAGLPASVAARMAQKAAQSWCYVTPEGNSFYVSEDQAKAMQERGGGCVFEPVDA